MREEIWIKDISILFNQDNLTKFIPNDKMDFNEKLNSIVRFSFYLTIILFLYNFSYLNLYIVIFAVAITYIIYQYKDEELDNETFKLDYFKEKRNTTTKKQDICRKPTKNNPFMNRLLTDTRDINACNIQDSNIKQEIEQNFNKKLYMNISDIYQKDNSQRQYYTTPVTNIVNNQTNFANWLYKTPPSCKEGNGNQCVANINSNFLADTALKYKYH